jgi:hypothetical protein
MFDLTQLKTKTRNPRKISDRDFEKLMGSVQEFPKMLTLRPIVYDPVTMEVLGGNQRLRALLSAGYKSIPEEWVKSAEDLTEDEKKRFVVQDNVEAGDWDFEILAEDWDKEDLGAWGVEMPTFDDEENKPENPYTAKVETPIYEPRDKKPKHKEVYDVEKFNTLVSDIEASAASKEDKEFLKIAASRHIVFNYELIADLYANSDAEVQSLMEKSALVLIDYQKAIENGFVRMSEEIAAQFTTGDE